MKAITLRIDLALEFARDHRVSVKKLWLLRTEFDNLQASPGFSATVVGSRVYIGNYLGYAVERASSNFHESLIEGEFRGLKVGIVILDQPVMAPLVTFGEGL